jgi:glutathione S-transferase
MGNAAPVTMMLYDLCGADRSLRFSPHCWRAQMALAHKGLDYETVPTAFTEIAAIEDGRSRTVPALNDDGAIVREAFDIAVHLDEAHPDLPALFGHDGVVAATRLVETWANTTIHPILSRMMIKDIHDVLAPADQAYFRESREKRFGKSLEEVQTGLDANQEALAKALTPARVTLGHHDWLGGGGPLYTDYILFGSLFWLAAITGGLPLPEDDAVAIWFERCLDLHDGLARKARRAA